MNSHDVDLTSPETDGKDAVSVMKIPTVCFKVLAPPPRKNQPMKPEFTGSSTLKVPMF